MDIDEEYFKSKEFRELLDSYEMSVHAGTHPFMDAEDFVDIADYYSYTNQVEQAEEVIGYALELYPHATLPNVFMARQALMDNDYETAEQYASQIESHDDPDYHYLHAEILIAQNRTDEADQYLRQYGTTVEPDEYGDFVKDCANLFIDYGVSQKAYEWMLRLRGDESDDFKELMARTLFGLGKYKDSERLFNELIDSHPFSKQYWNALASAQFMSEDYSSSITSSEYAIAIDPQDPESTLSKANGLFRLNNYEEALKFYKRYEELIPDDEFGVLHQGVCLVNLERFDEALERLDAALAISPDNSPYTAQIYQEMAFCYSAKKDPHNALLMLDRTESLDCDHTDMMVIRGHILLENKMIHEAEEAFKTAILRADDTPSVLLRIIVSLYDNRYIHACYHMLLQFFDLVSDNSTSFKGGHAYMALCCYDLGYAEEFMKHLKLAVEESPSEARMVLGCLFPPETKVSDYYAYMLERLKE